MAKVSQDLKERPLHDVVEGLFREQKHDIYLYTKGHLNHDHLWKPSKQAYNNQWETSSKEVPLLLKPSRIPTPTKVVQKERDILDAMCHFSIGSSGSVQPKHGHRTVKASRQSPVGGGKGLEVNPQRPNTQEGYVSDTAYVEELRLPELMLPLTSKKSPRKRSPREGKSRGTSVQETHQFVPSHLAGVTKKDQYEQFKYFQDEILRRSDASERNVLAGRKAVQHLEEQLFGELMKLDATERQGGPSFHKLQIYSNIWQELNQETPTFGGILSQIKTEYDRYMGSLLDTQPHRHSEILSRQVQSLTDSGLVLPGELSLSQEHVQKQEEEIMKCLDENERLRKAVREEQERETLQPDREEAQQVVRLSTKKDGASLSLSDQVLQLHADILTKMDEIEAVRQDLRVNYVPSSVCHNLEQNIRDSEADILKLLSTNEYLAKTIQQVENEVDRIFEKSDVPELDIRLIWKSINSLSSGLPGLGD